MQKQTWDDFGDILIALEETWPAVARHTMDPWIIRDGQGGAWRDVEHTTTAEANE